MLPVDRISKQNSIDQWLKAGNKQSRFGTSISCFFKGSFAMLHKGCFLIVQSLEDFVSC